MWRKRLRHAITYQAVRLFLALVNTIPRQAALLICDMLGRLAAVFATRTRDTMVSNIRMAYGTDLPETDAEALARDVFRNIGRNAVDALRLRKIDSENVDSLVRFQGLDNLQAAFDEGRGVVAVSAHLGNFELLGACLALKGFPVTVVATGLYDERLDRLLRANRSLGGVNLVPRSHATSAVLRALRQGHVVGLLVDQDTRVPGVFVQFFGRPAHTPSGPTVIAGRSGAPIVPMAIRRLEDDTHEITVNPAISVESRPSKDQVVAVTQRYTTELESFVRNSPAQWVWMHERWKTKPPVD